MYRNYYIINCKTKANQYPMPIPEKIFDVIKFSLVFSTMDLRSNYYQLLLLIEDWIKTTFWRTNQNDKDQFYY